MKLYLIAVSVCLKGIPTIYNVHNENLSDDLKDQYFFFFLSQCSSGYSMFCILKLTILMFISKMSPFPILRVFDGIFIFFPNFNRTFCKQTEDPDAVSYLGLHCLLLSHRKDARLMWVVKLMDKKVILILC